MSEISVERDWPSTLADSELEELDHFLRAHGGEESLLLDGVHGLLSANAIGPQPAPPEEWLPEILNEPFADADEGSAYLELLARLNESVAARNRGGRIRADSRRNRTRRRQPRAERARLVRRIFARRRSARALVGDAARRRFATDRGARADHGAGRRRRRVRHRRGFFAAERRGIRRVSGAVAGVGRRRRAILARAAADAGRTDACLRWKMPIPRIRAGAAADAGCIDQRGGAFLDVRVEEIRDGVKCVLAHRRRRQAVLAAGIGHQFELRCRVPAAPPSVWSSW